MPHSVRPIAELIEEMRAQFRTPYYLIDESRLLPNLQKIAELRARTGVKSVLALKCFSTWSVFELIGSYLDGSTSSSVHEMQLGHEKLGKEVHAYCVAFAEHEIADIARLATKVIFNSVSQLMRFGSRLGSTPLGLRLNPGISHSGYDLADPARPHSRLGVAELRDVLPVQDRLSGVMFHCNCENGDFAKFSAILEHIADRYESLLHRVEWVSLGGGISFTHPDYPFDAFCEKLARFARRFDVQLYLEPGEAVVAGSGFLVTEVLDVVRNGTEIAIVDAGAEPHMLDLLVYRMKARIEPAPQGPRTLTVAGRTCLAGDVFGTYAFPESFGVGSRIAFADAAGYTMVKKNWFNGLGMPSIVVRRLDGRIERVREFGYDEYRRSLS